MTKRFCKANKGVLYIYALILVGLFVMGFLWFITWASITNVRTAINISQYQNDTTYQALQLADTFMNNFWTYFLVIFFFGLLYYVLIYAQRKGTPVVYES